MMSIGAIAKIKPVKPPMVNTKIKPIDHNIGVSNVIEPFHMVAIQLKIFTPVGTAINMVAYMKNNSPASGIPTVNMWCAHTINERNAMAAAAYTIEL